MKALFVISLLLTPGAFACDACRDSDVLNDELKGAFQNYGAPPPGVGISSTPKAVPEEEFRPPRERTEVGGFAVPEPEETGSLTPRQAATAGSLPRSKPRRSSLRSLQDF